MDSMSELNKQLDEVIKAMKNEGLTDELFTIVRDLKDINGPAYFTKLIPRFCSDVQATLKNIATALEETELNFYDLKQFLIKIKGAISCIGACRLAEACSSFIRAVDDKSKERCVEAFNVLKQEYYILHDKLDNVLQLEMRLVGRDALTIEDYGHDDE